MNKNNLIKFFFSGLIIFNLYSCSSEQIKKPQKPKELTEACDPFVKFKIPLEFKDYKNKKLIYKGKAPLKFGRDFFIEFDSYSWDVNKDGKRDIGELYFPGAKEKGKKPLIYGVNIYNNLSHYNFRRNQIFDLFILDENMDGLSCDDKIVPQILDDGRFLYKTNLYYYLSKNNVIHKR